MKEVLRAPVGIAIVVASIAMFLGGFLFINNTCKGCAETKRRRMKQAAVNQAAADYRCSKVRYISGTPEGSIYVVEACGKPQWYRCYYYHGEARCYAMDSNKVVKGHGKAP
jgi:hypothetical protein